MSGAGGRGDAQQLAGALMLLPGSFSPFQRTRFATLTRWFWAMRNKVSPGLTR
ncbi:hypothetical protein JOS77_03625 [Chromobacterium haemolyticum]|nr:hypothetical protein JOS77_03625 [Chromobacterium haemolyticum]